MAYLRGRYPSSNTSDSSEDDQSWGSVRLPRDSGRLLRDSGRPPRRPPTSWRQDNKWQFVWPNDRDRGVWGRWKDLFTNKGPDIFIAEQNTPQPERPIWSNWKTRGHPHPDIDNIRWGNDGKSFRQDEEFDGVFGFQRRDPYTKYDFETRRYRRPNDYVWSGVEWSRTKPQYPIRRRSANGEWYPPRR